MEPALLSNVLIFLHKVGCVFVHPFLNVSIFNAFMITHQPDVLQHVVSLNRDMMLVLLKSTKRERAYTILHNKMSLPQVEKEKKFER